MRAQLSTLFRQSKYKLFKVHRCGTRGTVWDWRSHAQTLEPQRFPGFVGLWDRFHVFLYRKNVYVYTPISIGGVCMSKTAPQSHTGPQTLMYQRFALWDRCGKMPQNPPASWDFSQNFVPFCSLFFWQDQANAFRQDAVDPLASGHVFAPGPNFSVLFQPAQHCSWGKASV